MTKKLIPGIDYIGITTPFYCIDDKGKLLFHKRSETCRDERGMWDAGGGQLEFGEQPEEGVLREVKEEYDCNGVIEEQLPAISILRKQNNINTHWLAIPFIIRVRAEEVKNNDPDKIVELGWFDLKNLPQPLHSAFDKYIAKTDRIKYLEKYVI